jgi:hypothetical protein
MLRPLSLPRTLWALLACSGLLTAISGCNRSSDAEDETPKKTSKKNEIKISPLAGKLGTFDEGRIEVPLPKNWKESVNEEPADNDPNENLGRMNTGSQRAPGILVKVREYPDFKTLGGSDLRKFVRKRADEITKERGFKNKLDVKPLTLKGGFNGCVYGYTVNIGGRKFDRICVETVVDSRLYTLELFAVKGLREESRPDLYAVAAGLKFPKMINKPSRGRADDEEEATDEESEDADSEKSADKEKDEEETSDEE